MGAIASGGVRLLNTGILRDCCVTATEVEVTTRREEAELKRREAAYRRGRPPLSVSGRTVLVVDDGLATGTTVRAAIKALRGMGAKRLVVAVPVGASDTCRDLAREVDELVCPLRPPNLVAISLWYLNFSQTTDTEVRELLERGASNFAASETIRGEDASRHAG
jgi:predicted phosphoribosyltransferase